MSMIKKILLLTIIITLMSVSKSFSQNLKKVGKYKDWEVMVMSENSGKVCFAQSIPVLQAPKKTREKQDYLLLLDQVKTFQTKSAQLLVTNLMKRILS